jgi:cell division inhibitor SepF
VNPISNRPGTSARLPNPYDYEDETYGYDDSYDNSYDTGYTNSYDNGYDSRHDRSYDNRYISLEQQSYGQQGYERQGYGQQGYQSRDVNAYDRSDRPSRSRYGNSSYSTSVASANSAATNKVANIASSHHRVTEVLVIEPTSFEDIPHVIQALRDYKSVVLNLATMSPDYVQRAIDFITGGTHAMDGNHERIGEGIFLFTPNCVHVSNHISPVAR